jgi:hypothetical protein
VALASCAGVAPVPGGSETVNSAYYQSADDFKTRVNTLQAGMSEDLVMDILGRQPADMQRLTRNEVVLALYGPNTMQVLDSRTERDETHKFLKSLYGYKLEYKDVDKHLGLSSLIRMSTEESGFGYAVYLIFQNGKLVEKPEVTGGVINETTSKTLFEYISPGSLLGI